MNSPSHSNRSSPAPRPPTTATRDQFFARTYFTAAMREQVGTVLRRLAGETEGAPPVLSFITQFGGGKTHTLTALWHLAGLGPDAVTLPGVPDLLAREHLSAVPRARLGVFVGNAWDPSRRAADAVARSRLPAWRRGRDRRRWATSRARSPPGTEALARLFAAPAAPCWC